LHADDPDKNGAQQQTNRAEELLKYLNWQVMLGLIHPLGLF
jgi:hypothetical protein